MDAVVEYLRGRPKSRSERHYRRIRKAEWPAVSTIQHYCGSWKVAYDADRQRLREAG